MGLCKCPKRRVTNQFCFEHRVNVCEHCLVTNHPKCIVQSYLQWLQDSDYNPICEICTKDLESEDCIRLTCYHVYHWWCLNDWARSLPADLAPAGYTCPSCRSPLFPPSNLVSPVADVLREKLSGVNWARTGLGLPLLSDEVYQPIRPNNSNSSEIRSGVLDEKTTQPSDHSILHIPAPTSHPFARSSESSHHESAAYAALPRRAPHEAELRSNVVFDRDEDKYKRKRFRDWMFWKRKSLFSPSRGRHQLRFVLVLFVIVGLVFILFKKFGSDNDEYDANFDVRKNPQIHIQENKISIEHES